MDKAAEGWIRDHVEPVAPIENVRDRPWATVFRVPLADGTAWFKACAPVQAFEPALTAALHGRRPDRVARVLAHDIERRWLLLDDAGTPLDVLENPPETWLRVLPLYAELQLGESAHAAEHLAAGVPALRLPELPELFDDLLRNDLPLGAQEVDELRDAVPRFAAWCEELAGHGIGETVQHDDLHMKNVYARGDDLRILDWGDASVSHPFASLVVTFRFLEERNGLDRSDPWFGRLRDAYLEPWGRGFEEAFELALRVGAFAHAFAWARQREYLAGEARRGFDNWFAVVLRRALARVGDDFSPNRQS